MEQEVSDIVIFLGRFHPLILHLPIGFLVIAFILEICSRFEKFRNYRSAVGFILLLGGVFAGVAALLGYMLAQSGGYSEELLNIHQWAGIGVAVTALLAFLLKRWYEKHPSVVLDRLYLSVLSVMMLVLTVAGHYGGSLTHGTDYLTQYMPNGLRTLVGLPPKQESGFHKITNLEEAVVFNDIIHPILDSRCISCHNESKFEGELQMHTRELLLQGGKSGPIFVEGNAGESELIRRINLPERHDDHMPPDGKRQLTDDQIELLAWWINAGAPFDQKVAEVEVDEEVQTILDELVDPDANKSEAEKLLASDVDPANEQLLEDLRDQGISIMPLAAGSNWLQAKIPGDLSADSLITTLTEVSKQLTWLDLGGTATSDRALSSLADFTNLTRLYLQNTQVTDTGMSYLAGLPYLDYLNLYGTSVSDEGIRQLKELKHLNKLFVWQTQVTEEGVTELQEALPALEASMGLDLDNDSSVAADRIDEIQQNNLETQ